MTTGARYLCRIAEILSIRRYFAPAVHAVILHLQLADGIVPLGQLGYQTDLIQQCFDQVDICQGRFGAGSRQSDYHVAAVRPLGDQLCSGNANVVYLSHDRLDAVVNFGTDFCQKRLTYLQPGKLLTVAGPAVAVSIYDYHDEAVFGQNVENLPGNLVIQSIACRTKRVTYVHGVSSLISSHNDANKEDFGIIAQQLFHRCGLGGYLG